MLPANASLLHEDPSLFVAAQELMVREDMKLWLTARCLSTCDPEDGRSIQTIASKEARPSGSGQLHTVQLCTVQSGLCVYSRQ